MSEAVVSEGCNIICSEEKMNTSGAVFKNGCTIETKKNVRNNVEERSSLNNDIKEVVCCICLDDINKATTSVLSIVDTSITSPAAAAAATTTTTLTTNASLRDSSVINYNGIGDDEISSSLSLPESTTINRHVEQETATRATYRLSCDHIYHAACINGWLDCKMACPLCRHKVTFEEYANSVITFVDEYLRSLQKRYLEKQQQQQQEQQEQQHITLPTGNHKALVKTREELESLARKKINDSENNMMMIECDSSDYNSSSENMNIFPQRRISQQRVRIIQKVRKKHGKPTIYITTRSENMVKRRLF